MKDLLKLIGAWGQDERAVDIVPDGVVDQKDLEVLMDHWQQDVNDATLLAHWALDEAQGKIACDSAGICDAALAGDPAWNPAGGQIDGALLLDGLDDCAVAPFVVNPADGPFSVLAWVKGGAPGEVIVSQRDDLYNPGASWLCCDAVAGKLMTTLVATAGRLKSSPMVAECVITDGAWHHVGLVYDGSVRSLYVDGAEVASDTGPAGVKGTQSGMNIGAGKDLAPGTFWSGLIDDVRIYRRAVKP